MDRSLKVLLGVSGGIAAFKAPEILRRLVKRGHAVRCVMSRSAGSFVTPLTLEVLSGHPVYREEYLTANHSGEELHLTAAGWADVYCVAPATCNTLAKLALGLADDFLSTTALAWAGPLILAPAMDSVMWSQQVVQGHVSALRDRGVIMVGPVRGPLASGKSGVGRMAEPSEIVAAVEMAAAPRDLQDRFVLITAGPTREPIDPVRYLSNRSSGKMGFSLAAAAARRGARTLLVAGPVALPTPAGVERVEVTTAEEMLAAVRALAPEADLVVMTAAVSDFRPSLVSAHKIKKRGGVPRIDLEPTPDILAELPEIAPRALRVGFAAESRDLEEEAAAKLEAKGAHFVVANDISLPDVGFESDDNEVVVLSPGREPLRIERQSKERLAYRLLDLFAEALRNREAELVSRPR